jgi:hypothetical protein
MGRRRCCCGCVQFFDDFERADAETLGSNWEMIDDAEWHIDGNRAKGIKGIALWTGRLPDTQGSMLVTVSVVNPQYGDVVYAILSAKDENNYLFAKISAPQDEHAEQVWTMSIGSVSGGIETEFADDVNLNLECPSLDRVEFIPGQAQGIRVAFDRRTLQMPGVGGDGSDNVGGLWRCESAPGSSANRVGMRHGGGSGPVYIDTFWASEHYRTNSECPDLGCSCGWECTADTLKLTLSVEGGDCDAQATFPMDVDLKRFKKNERVWRSDEVLLCKWSDGTKTTHRFWLMCDGSINRQPTYRLTMLATSDGDTPCPPIKGLIPTETHGAALSVPVLIECDPLHFVFDFENMKWWVCCFPEEDYPPPPWVDPDQKTLRCVITE